MDTERRCYEILPRFCLSDREFASCKQCLALDKITHVVTVDGTELIFKNCAEHSAPEYINVHHEVQVKFVYALDQLNFDILDLFTKTIEYIDRSLKEKEGNKLLVHCFAGQSRSASIVAAYLMWVKNISLKEALENIKTIKSDTQPNAGFLYQLWLYESMGNCVDTTSNHYKTFRTKQEQLSYYRTLYSKTQVPETKIETPATRDDGSNGKTDTYKCRMCRTVLFTSECLSEKHSTATTNTCSSVHLVEPTAWMRKQMKDQVQGKINCSKCNGKIGSFNWSGTTCSCGLWVTPSFQIQKAKVDVS